MFAAPIFCEVSIAVACLTGTGVVERQGAKVVLALPSLRLQIISCDCTFLGYSTSHRFRGLNSRPLAAPAVPVYGRSRQLSLFSIPGRSLAVLATVAFGSFRSFLSLTYTVALWQLSLFSYPVALRQLPPRPPFCSSHPFSFSYTATFDRFC